MPDIRISNGICTQITMVKLPPNNQEEVLSVMKERARFMANQPGFVSETFTAARTAATS
jgi:heme-degrading monooxygenase HmoA